VEDENGRYGIVALRVVSIFLVICAGFFLLYVPCPAVFDPHRYLLQRILSLGHIPLFAGLAWAILAGINIRTRKARNWPIWSYFAAFMITLALSVLSELGQMITSRDASKKDLLYDNLGCVFFLGVVCCWTNHKVSERLGVWKKHVRVVFILVVSIVVAVLVRPLVLSGVDEIEKRRNLPIIGSFETEREVRRWHGGASELLLADEWVEDGRYSLRVKLSPGTYSGIMMPHPPRNWRGYKFLKFSVLNPSEKRMKLVVKIFDWDHNYEYEDRFNTTMDIAAGVNRMSIALKEIEASPGGRRMRMDRIAQISFFLRDVKQEKILFLDNIRLSLDSGRSKEGIGHAGFGLE